MKIKTSILIIMIILAIQHYSIAQKNIDTKKISDELCQCLTQEIVKYPKPMQNFLNDKAVYGLEIAKKNMEKYAKDNPEEIKKMYKSSNKILHISVVVAANCPKIEEEYGQIHKSFTDEQHKQIISNMRKKKDCLMQSALLEDYIREMKQQDKIRKNIKDEGRKEEIKD